MKRKRKILPARCSRTKNPLFMIHDNDKFFSSSCIVIIAPLSYNIVALPIDSFEWHFFVLLQSVLAGKRGRGSSCKRRSNVFTLNFSHSQLPKYFHLLLKDLYWILNQIKEALTDIFCGSIRPGGISSSC